MAFMRKIVVLACICLFASCDWFTSKEDKTQELVHEEMQNINFNEVDRYPMFSDCDEMVSKPAQRICFETTLLMHFSRTLEDFDFVIDTEVKDTIYVDFMMDRNGSISVLGIQKNSNIDDQMPEFNGIITQSLKSMPKIEPALKRGIPVNAKFRIPIVLNSN
ncbi:hypothetical protein GCM10007383_20500 [Arenibacter certesii]|uniref:TonB C-terminal domain-containing protein n=2 Tax=Arenibacter certesii TaxID=228955 RepID=A0A918IXF4_9FLAO|nr:hypothetical protein GCM10007383_20500 [Arenibacter certesii]